MLTNSMGLMECVGSFNDCRDVIANVEATKPDVVRMDIDMPFVNGIEGVRLIRTKFPDLQVLMQTVVGAVSVAIKEGLVDQKQPFEWDPAVASFLKCGNVPSFVTFRNQRIGSLGNRSEIQELAILGRLGSLLGNGGKFAACPTACVFHSWRG
jgi:DNA-binding NtrC family response regulator